MVDPTILRWLIAAVHLLAMALSFVAITSRAHLLRGSLGGAQLSRVFTADNLWGLSAILAIGTGVPRAFFGLEKGTAYYVAQPLFGVKLAVLIVILLLEIRPMVTLIRWRIASRRGRPVDTAAAGMLARVSSVQAFLLVVMVLCAAAIARGVFGPA